MRELPICCGVDTQFGCKPRINLAFKLYETLESARNDIEFLLAALSDPEWDVILQPQIERLKSLEKIISKMESCYGCVNGESVPRFHI